MSVTTTWAGSVSGAGASTAIVEITRDGTRIEGQLRLFQPSVGQMHARLIGEWNDDNKLSAKLERFMGSFSSEMALPQSGSIDGVFDPDENALRGHWKTDAGAEGDLWWVCVANQSPMEALTPVVELPRPDRYSQPSSGRIQPVVNSPAHAHSGKHKTRWLAIGLGVMLAALIGYILMSSLLDVLLDG